MRSPLMLAGQTSGEAVMSSHHEPGSLAGQRSGRESLAEKAPRRRARNRRLPGGRVLRIQPRATTGPRRGRIRRFLQRRPRSFAALVDSLLYDDQYRVLADYQSYIDAQDRVEHAYRDPRAWTRSAVLNVARSGFFSSDRATATTTTGSGTPRHTPPSPAA